MKHSRSSLLPQLLLLGYFAKVFICCFFHPPSIQLVAGEKKIEELEKEQAILTHMLVEQRMQGEVEGEKLRKKLLVRGRDYILHFMLQFVYVVQLSPLKFCLLLRIEEHILACCRMLRKPWTICSTR